MLQDFWQLQSSDSLHRNVQGKFLRGQAVMDAYILPILSNIEQYYTFASSGIGAEDKDAKYSVTPVILNSSDKLVPLITY